MASPFKPNCQDNPSFSNQLPQLQLAIDSTSLGEFKTCPRKYFYSIIMGYQPRQESVHLTFGLLLHGAVERYHHARCAGQGHDDALDVALDWALRNTWDKAKQRPWIPDHKAANIKNRMTLVRTLVHYLDLYGANDTIETLRQSNGKPTVELSFAFDSGIKAVTGEAIVFCGHLDRLGRLGDDYYVTDIKTTGHQLSPHWFQSFTPGNQFSMYMLGGQIAYSVPVKGIIVDGVRVAVGFNEFQRGIVTRTPDQLAEWLADAAYYVKQMGACAQAGHWPLNDKACDMFGGCPFRSVCSRAGGARQQWLDVEYVSRPWSPITARGDI